MLNRFVDAFKSKEVRGRIFFTLAILFIYVIGLLIAVPGVEVNNINETLNNNDILGIMNMLSGGALDSFSIFALGVSPYITASIIIQLLQMGVLPKLQELSEQGEAGRRKINDITRYLGLLLGAVQGYGIIVTLDNQDYFDFSGIFDVPKWLQYTYVICILLAGTMFVMWLSDQITAKGIGNGVSMIIFAGIVKGIPSDYNAVYQILVGTKEAGAESFNGMLQFIAYVAYTAAIILFVIFIELSVRKIPIQQSKTTMSQSSNHMNFLPIKLNPGGVIPVIFAQAVLSAPVTILGFIDSNSSTYEKIKNLFSINHLENGWPIALIIYIVLIILFSFMYAHIQIDADKLSENLTKQGSYIPGIRSGVETRNYLNRVLNRVTFVGAFALAFVAAMPYVVPMIFPTLANTSFGGTGLIIVVGVALETTSQLDGYVAERNYKTFNFDF